jgi:CBS domain containing-hemolysin-like protein
MLLFWIITFLLLSAFFSGSEIAFVSADKLNIEVLKQKGARRGSILASFYDKPDRFIGTMLVGNNISLVFYTTLFTLFLTPFFENEIFLFLSSTLLATIIVLLFGEFLPKTIFRLFADQLLYFFAYPLRFFSWLLSFPAWIMTVLSNLLLKYVFRATFENSEYKLTRLDLARYVSSSYDHDEEIDTNMFNNALKLKDTKVKECMVPRTEIVFVDVHDSVEHVKQIFNRSKHSRLIVIDDDIDEIVGYVHHQQFWQKPKNVRKVVLDIPLVPEAMNVKDLLLKLTREQTNIAWVVDEFGGTAGVITLEDILEEIFGEIEDEYDKEDFIDEQISDNEFLFSGRLEVDFLNEKYDLLKLPEGDYTTLSGYIVMTTGAIPEQKEIIELNNIKFILEKVSDTKIETVRVVVLESNEQVDEIEEKSE